MAMAYAMCTSVVQTRLLASGPDSTVTFGVTDESIFKQLKLSLISFLRGNGNN
jgi:hypothetical protein